MVLVEWQNTKFQFMVGAFVSICLLVLGLLLNQPIVCLLPIPLCILILSVKDIRIPFYLLVFSLPLSLNLQDKAHINLDFPDVPLMLLLTALFIFIALINHATILFRKIVSHPIVIIVLLSFAWTAVSVVFSPEPLFSSKYLAKKVWFLIPFLFLPILLFRQTKIIVRSAQIIVGILSIIAVIILVRFSALGFRFEDVHDPIQPFFMNHVMYGSMLSCIVPICFGALLLSRKLSMQWMIAIACLAVLLIATYFSYSRAAWMGVVFGACIYVCVRWKLAHIAMLSFMGLVLAGVLWMSTNNKYLEFKPQFEKTIMHESIMDHLLATIQGTDISSAERYYRWIAAIRMCNDHPLTGVGPNNFYDYYKSYTITSFRTWVSRNPEKSTTHNYFLFMLVEQGYPAMILYAILIFFIFWFGQKTYHRLQDRQHKIIVMSVLCMIAALFINNFFSELLEADKIGSLFYMGLAVLVVMDFSSREIPIVD